MIFRRNKIAAIALCGVFTAALATPFSAGISACVACKRVFHRNANAVFLYVLCAVTCGECLLHMEDCLLG